MGFHDQNYERAYNLLDRRGHKGDFRVDLTHHKQKPLHDFVGFQVVLYRRERGRGSHSQI